MVHQFPATPIAVVSGSAINADVRAVVRAGARGFVPKTATGPHLSHALEMILSGGTSVPADMLLEDESQSHAKSGGTGAMAAAWLEKLTSREIDVLKGLLRGLSNKEIGRDLQLAEITVKLHMRSIFRKIGARNRADAAVLASKANLG